jgi:hypothetical protein
MNRHQVFFAVALAITGATWAARASDIDSLTLTPSGANTMFAISGTYAPDTPTTFYSSPNTSYSLTFTLPTAPSPLSFVDTADGIFGVDTTVKLNHVMFPSTQIAFFVANLGGGLDVCLSDVCSPDPPTTFDRWVIVGDQLFSGSVSNPVLIAGTASIDPTQSTIEFSTPEPTTVALVPIGLGLMALVLYKRRKPHSYTAVPNGSKSSGGMLKFSAVLTLASVIGGAQSLPNLFPLPNASGFVETYNINNTSIDLTGPFFQSLGTNGRSCFSCHRPAEGWSVSAAEVQLRFLLTQGLDPIFRTNDGSNCDHNIDSSTVEGRRAAYSLLLSRGLIRISLPVPANAQFSVVSVQNPYGCNDTSALSMYRRPLPSTNLKFLSTVMFDGRESSPQTGTTKITYATNPGDLLADLGHQAIDATTVHAQAATPPTPQQVQAIVNFEMQLRTAQAIDFRAGFLSADGATGGPLALASQPFFIGINDSFPSNFGFNPFGTPFNPAIFDLFNAWANSENPLRASIARGQTIFNTKIINITDVAGINDVLGIQSLPGSCGTCHDSPNVGDHSFPAPLNIGVGDLTSPLDVSYLPVFTLQNKSTGIRVQTTDPGRALITGLWADVGKVKGPILRGLAARAPYFHNASAASLRDVVTFYDKRFNVGFTAQEKADLVAFLNSL